MMLDSNFGLDGLCRLSDARSRSISAENPTGEKGHGGMAQVTDADSPARDLGQGWKVSPFITIKPGQTAELASIAEPGVIDHIWMVDNSQSNRSLVLRMYWENCPLPSVETPLGDFFACADQQHFSQISSPAVCVNPNHAFNCYWRMPFRESCRITLENISEEPVIVYYQIDYLLTGVPEDCAYFHAQFRRINPLPYKETYTLLDNVKGKGQYVGTYMFWGSHNNGWWGEGEIKFYIDGDREFPTICGTGTEDYFCGGYGFMVNNKYRAYTTPYAGFAMLSGDDETYDTQPRFSMYRWHLADPVYFSEDIRVTIQALGWRNGMRFLPLQEDISSVSFWYQDKPCTGFPRFPSADELEII